MNRARIAASSRDAALRTQQRKFQESLIAANSAAEEHAAELQQGPRRRSRAIRWPTSWSAAPARMPMPASICRAKTLPIG
jgi:hypothetical protein